MSSPDEHYQEIAQALTAERQQYLAKANAELAPALWARIQQRLRDNPPMDPTAKSQFANELNIEVDKLGLAFLCPITKKPAHLRAPSSGEFHLVPYRAKNPSINRRDIAEFFSEVTKNQPLQFTLSVSTLSTHLEKKRGSGWARAGC